MSEGISDLANQAGPAARLKIWTLRDGPSQNPFPARTNHDEHYQRIAHNPRYRHFVRIPARIVRCLDYFKIRANRSAAAQILDAYYVFIGVVDNAIDSGAPKTANMVFDLFAAPSSSQPPDSDVALVTYNLRRYVNDEIELIVNEKLHELYAAVLQERLATSVEPYIDSRKTVGRLTADLSYVLIRPLLPGEEITLRAFMQRVGAVGCLVDSIIDLGADRRGGLVSFAPTIGDHIKLIIAALFEGLSIGLEHPRLAGLFVHAILDNVRDRFIVRSDWMKARTDSIRSNDERHGVE